MGLKKSIRFTPDLLVSAPRYSAAVPNPEGSHALFNVSTYSLSAHTELKEVKVIDLKTGLITLFSDDESVDMPTWLVGTKVLWKKTVDQGKAELWCGEAIKGEKNAYLLGTIDAPITEIKTKMLENGDIALAFSAPYDEHENLLNPDSLPIPKSSAREYESIRIRFWDTYWKPYRYSLWYTTITYDNGSYMHRLSTEAPHNALRGTKIEYPMDQGPAMMTALSFDISTSGLLVTAFIPTYNPAERAVTEVYYIGLETFQEPLPTVIPLTQAWKGWSGSAFAGVFSHHKSNRKVAFMKRKDWKNDTENSVCFIASLDDVGRLLETPENLNCRQLNILDETESYWDHSLSRVIFANDEKQLYGLADDKGRIKIFQIGPLEFSAAGKWNATVKSKTLTLAGTVSSIFPRSENKSDSALLVNTSSFTDSSAYHILDFEKAIHHAFFSATKQGSLLGISSSQVSELWYAGAGDYDCQCFIIKPSFFRNGAKYPTALWIHGGPQDAWRDAWSTRWNPLVMAEQGYIIVLPNITGSLGFGPEFSEAVLDNWGGRPYDDLVKCWEYVETRLEYADQSRAVCFGASYGGYMVNWIAGQPLAKKFLTLVCHDGIFDTLNLMSGDVSWTVPRDMGGAIFESSKLKHWDRYSPSRYTANWTQPMLIIHSDNDYRCPITEGLSAFNVCQAKGIRSRFVNFPDENHFVLKRENSRFLMRTFLGWCNDFVGIKDGIRLQKPVSEPYGHAFKPMNQK